MGNVVPGHSPEGRPGRNSPCRVQPADTVIGMDEEMGKISDAVVDDLTFDPDLDASDITVEDKDGEVVLTGSVPSYPQYLEAAVVASRAPGVSFVRNYLEVVLPPDGHRDDPTLTAMANDALTLGRTVAVGVEATAKNGNVTLSGSVRCAAEQAAAEAMIADLTGVRSVTNDIQIRADSGPLPPTTSRWSSHERLARHPGS
jgi:osmotically-inducible protein OsmY